MLQLVQLLANKRADDARREKFNPGLSSVTSTPLPDDAAQLLARAWVLFKGIEGLKDAQRTIPRDAEIFKQRIKDEPATRNKPKASSMDGLGATRSSWNEAVSRS